MENRALIFGKNAIKVKDLQYFEPEALTAKQTAERTDYARNSIDSPQ